MANILADALEWYKNNVTRMSDPRISHLPLMGSPVSITVLLVCYYCFVRHLGPRFMANRKPYKLERCMKVYNIVQALMNLWFFFEAFRLLWLPRRYSLKCQPVDYSNDPVTVEILYKLYLFFINRCLDLFDTVFIVFKKNDRQITFLHVYHHSMVTAFAWFITNYMAGGHIAFFGTINSFVHGVMYSYYLLTTVFPDFKKHVWLKKHITQMQLAQFVICSVHHIYVFLNPNCTYPKSVIFFMLMQTIIILLMFCNFYRKSYLKRKTM